MEGFNFSHKEPQISSLPQFASWFSVGNTKVIVCRYCNDKYCMEMNEKGYTLDILPSSVQ